jgi:hypothetical protein
VQGDIGTKSPSKQAGGKVEYSDHGVSEQSELVHAMPKNEIKSERRRQPRSMQGWVYRGGGLCSASKIWGLPVEDLESGRRFCSAASRGGGLELTVQGEHSSVKRKKMNIEFIDIPFLNLKNMN